MLLPADVLLFSSPGAVSAAIGKAQRAHGFAASHALWSHVALYIGDEMAVEAQPAAGVALRNLYTLDGRERMLVRRRAGLSLEDRYRVVVRALTDLGKEYSVTRLPSLVLRALRGPASNPGLDASAQGVVICSTLVADAFSTVASVDFKARDRDITWPADLSRADVLHDLAVGWVKVTDDSG